MPIKASPCHLSMRAGGLIHCRCAAHSSGPTCGIVTAGMTGLPWCRLAELVKYHDLSQLVTAHHGCFAVLAGNEQIHTVLTNALSARSFHVSFYIKTADVAGEVRWLPKRGATV